MLSSINKPRFAADYHLKNTSAKSLLPGKWHTENGEDYVSFGPLSDELKAQFNRKIAAILNDTPLVFVRDEDPEDRSIYTSLDATKTEIKYETNLKDNTVLSDAPEIKIIPNEKTATDIDYIRFKPTENALYRYEVLEIKKKNQNKVVIVSDFSSANNPRPDIKILNDFVLNALRNTRANGAKLQDNLKKIADSFFS